MSPRGLLPGDWDWTVEDELFRVMISTRRGTPTDSPMTARRLPDRIPGPKRYQPQHVEVPSDVSSSSQQAGNQNSLPSRGISTTSNWLPRYQRSSSSATARKHHPPAGLYKSSLCHLMDGVCSLAPGCLANLTGLITRVIARRANFSLLP